jgi:hypothetical protein
MVVVPSGYYIQHYFGTTEQTFEIIVRNLTYIYHTRYPGVKSFWYSAIKYITVSILMTYIKL